MEQDPVARVEKEDDGEERGTSAERSGGEEPAGSPRVEKRHTRLGEGPARKSEESPDHKRSDRRAPEYVSEVDRIGLEELDPRSEVGSEVATPSERHRESLEPPDPDRDTEDRDRCPARLRCGGGAIGLPRCLGEPAHSPTG